MQAAVSRMGGSIVRGGCMRGVSPNAVLGLSKWAAYAAGPGIF